MFKNFIVLNLIILVFETSLATELINQPTQQKSEMFNQQEVFKSKNKMNVVSVPPLVSELHRCGLTTKTVKSTSSLDDIYGDLDQTYLLVKSKTILREVVFKKGTQKHKIKIESDLLQLYSMDDPGIIKPISVDNTSLDAKQKMKTISGQVKQLTINAQIESDWSEIHEWRSEGVEFQLRRSQSLLTELVIKIGNHGQVRCESVEKASVCLCQKN